MESRTVGFRKHYRVSDYGIQEKEIENMENLTEESSIKGHDEGATMFSMGIRSFMDLAESRELFTD